jgi:hypothetical protein
MQTLINTDEAVDFHYAEFAKHLDNESQNEAIWEMLCLLNDWIADKLEITYLYYTSECERLKISHY